MFIEEKQKGYFMELEIMKDKIEWIYYAQAVLYVRYVRDVVKRYSKKKIYVLIGHLIVFALNVMRGFHNDTHDMDCRKYITRFTYILCRKDIVS